MEIQSEDEKAGLFSACFLSEKAASKDIKAVLTRKRTTRHPTHSISRNVKWSLLHTVHVRWRYISIRWIRTFRTLVKNRTWLDPVWPAPLRTTVRSARRTVILAKCGNRPGPGETCSTAHPTRTGPAGCKKLGIDRRQEARWNDRDAQEGSDVTLRRKNEVHQGRGIQHG